MRRGNCVAEFWETCRSLSTAEAMNQGCDAAIRQVLCCNSAGDGVGIFTSELEGGFTRNVE